MGYRTDRTVRQKILNEAKLILKKHLAHIDAEVFLFGSWARKEEGQSSDLDIALLVKEKSVPQGLFTEIRTAFEESTIPYHTDIVDLSIVDQPFKDKVFQEGIRWHV